MALGSQQRVATPFARRMRIARERIFPLMTWCVAIGVAAVLYQRQGQHVDVIGLMESKGVLVAAIEDGTLEGLGVELYETVTEGEVIGILDGALIEAELVVAMAELQRLRSEFDAGRALIEKDFAEREKDTFNDYRRFLINAEGARLDLLEKTVEQSVNRVKIERFNIVQESQRRLVDANIVDSLAYEETRLQYEAVVEDVRLTEKTIEFLQERMEMLEARAKEFESPLPDPELEVILSPLQSGIAVQEAQIKLVETRRAQNILRAPIAGVVSNIFHRPGDVLMAGTPIISITNPRADTVVAYLDDSDRTGIAVGTEVTVSSRASNGPEIKGAVTRVGQTIEEVPLPLRRNQRMLQWGLPVVVSQLPDSNFLPGEVVNLRLRTQ